MKGIVIYHSMTGNTKRIAQSIHEGMQRVTPDCDIVPIKDVQTGDLEGYTVIGLGSPVIRGRELQNVTDFIEMKLKSVDGKYGFAFCTHGAMPGRYLARVIPAMYQRGLTIIGWNDWFGGAFFPAVPKPYFTDGHPDDIDLAEAAAFGAEMMNQGRRLARGEQVSIPTFPRGAEYDRIYTPGAPPPIEVLTNFYSVQSRMGPLKVNEAKCRYPKCSLCIDHCPMQCIDFSEGQKVFGINCARCFQCEQACPMGAIEIDWQPFHDAHLPMIAPLEQSLEIFEKRGAFRRLVATEDIGWDNFLWKKKHPRIKLA